MKYGDLLINKFGTIGICTLEFSLYKTYIETKNGELIVPQTVAEQDWSVVDSPLSLTFWQLRDAYEIAHRNMIKQHEQITEKSDE